MPPPRRRWAPVSGFAVGGGAPTPRGHHCLDHPVKTPPNAPPPAHHPAAIPPAAHPRRRGAAASRCTVQTAHSRFRPGTAAESGPSASSLTKTTISCPSSNACSIKSKANSSASPAGGDRFLPALHLGVERAAHRVKGFVAIQRGVKAAAPRGQQRQRAGCGPRLRRAAAPRQPCRRPAWRVGVAPRGKQAAGSASCCWDSVRLKLRSCW